jgi:hypothetical protein
VNPKSIVKKIVREILSDADGSLSSKRVIAALSFLIMVVAFVADLIWQMTITDYIFNGFLALTLGALGITGVESFANRTTTTKTKVQADVNVGGTPPPEE